MLSALFVCLLQELRENYWISGQEDLWKDGPLVQENTINLEKGIKWIYCIVILRSKCINARHDQAHFILPSVSNQKDFNQKKKTTTTLAHVIVAVVTLSASILPRMNSDLQNCRACSKERPMPLRKRPYCMRPPCRRWWFSLRLWWSCLMQSGNDFPESWWTTSNNKRWETICSSLISATVLEILNSRFFLFLS